MISNSVAFLSSKYGDPTPHFSTEQASYIQQMAADVHTLQQDRFNLTGKLSILESNVSEIKGVVLSMAEKQSKMEEKQDKILDLLQRTVIPKLEQSASKEDANGITRDIQILKGRFDALQNSIEHFDDRIKRVESH